MANITKKEWVLDGDTVSYGHALDLKETLEKTAQFMKKDGRREVERHW